MKQRIADALQIVGAVGLTVACGVLFSLAVAVAVGSVLAIVAGVVMERT